MQFPRHLKPSGIRCTPTSSPAQVPTRVDELILAPMETRLPQAAGNWQVADCAAVFSGRATGSRRSNAQTALCQELRHFCSHKCLFRLLPGTDEFSKSLLVIRTTVQQVIEKRHPLHYASVILGRQHPVEIIQQHKKILQVCDCIVIQRVSDGESDQPLVDPYVHAAARRVFSSQPSHSLCVRIRDALHFVTKKLQMTDNLALQQRVCHLSHSFEWIVCYAQVSSGFALAATDPTSIQENNSLQFVGPKTPIETPVTRPC